MLDTGASDTVLSPQYARDLGVSVRRARDDRPYERETVLGRSLQFWVDTRASETRARPEYEYGLLGGVFLAEYVLEIDFPRRRVRFIDPERYTVPKEVSAPNEAVVPVKIIGNRPIVTVEVEGKPIEVMLDTGAWDTMLISGAAAKKAGFERPVIAKTLVGGVVGNTEGQLVEAEKIALGPFAFAPALITISPRGFYNQGPSTDSLVGYEVLKHFVMRLDYPRKRLWLQRKDEDPLEVYGVPWTTARRVGVLAGVRDEGIWVQAVVPDSPAASSACSPEESPSGEATGQSRCASYRAGSRHGRRSPSGVEGRRGDRAWNGGRRRRNPSRAAWPTPRRWRARLDHDHLALGPQRRLPERGSLTSAPVGQLPKRSRVVASGSCGVLGGPLKLVSSSSP
jgi:predicted aspartyl protease